MRSKVKKRQFVWATAIISSLALIAFVLALVDWQLAHSILNEANYPLVVLGVGLLGLEGLLTALRFQLLAANKPGYLRCLRASGWYVLFLLALPARLGEVAGVGVIVRHMEQHPGEGVANLLLQRLFDVIVLGMMFCLVGLQFLSGSALFGSLLVIFGLLVGISQINRLLGSVMRILIPRRQRRWARLSFKVLAQLRRGLNRNMSLLTTYKLTVITLAKWFLILAGIGCVVSAVMPELNITNALGVGIAYNLAGIIPLQTIGGAGISELVLLSSFKWLGYTTAVGATLAVAIRLALLVGPLGFALLVIFWFELVKRRAAGC